MNNQNVQIQTCKCGCFVFDAECKKCVQCGAERENTPQDNVPKGESVERVSKKVFKRVFEFINNITASVVFEDPNDYSAGIKGAEVDYTPETIEELAAELNLKLVDQTYNEVYDQYSDIIVKMGDNHTKLQSRITELEQQLAKNKFSADCLIEWQKLTIAELEAKSARYMEALERMSNYPFIEPSATNYVDGYNDALKVSKMLAQQALNPKTKTDG